MKRPGVAYCTNVHPGVTLEAVCENLRTHVAAVKREVSPDAALPVGLWLPFDAANEALADPARLEMLKQTLIDHDLQVTSFNGFPYQSFHHEPVKQRVYHPDWTTAERFDYTLALAKLLGELVPEGGDAGISTLPLGYRKGGGGAALSPADLAVMQASATRLTELVHWLARLELDTGRCIHIDLEPEPGCMLQRSGDVVDFFEQHLLGTLDEPSVRGYLRVCHDVCHAAVMREEQAEVLERYRRAGLTVGKVQISSALAAEQDAHPDRAVREALGRFVEPVYQHQTTVVGDDGAMRFYDDLPEALAADDAVGGGSWRVHFHVPVFMERIGALGTTREAIAEALQGVRGVVRGWGDMPTLEVETYAWSALPEELQPASLTQGIAQELRWVGELLV